jgi:PAS domain S-box-containing protein
MTHESHAIVLLAADGVIQYWSRGAERLFGHAAADAVGRPADVMIPEKFRAKHWAGFRRAVATGHAPGSGGRTNLPILCGDGEVRVSPGTFHFLTDAHGESVGGLGIWGAPVGGEETFGPILPRAPKRA